MPTKLPRGGGSWQDLPMFSVTFREGVLVLAILGALIVGAAIKHWRDARREHPLSVPAGATAEQPR